MNSISYQKKKNDRCKGLGTRIQIQELTKTYQREKKWVGKIIQVGFKSKEKGKKGVIYIDKN